MVQPTSTGTFTLHPCKFVDICEDPEIKERILELRNEQETKRQAEARRKVRRSQSNTRTQSVRRTSLRDKGLTARRDAVEEARFRLQAGVANVSDTYHLV